VISANGTSDGIVWVMTMGLGGMGAVLRAFDAENLGTEYSTAMKLRTAATTLGRETSTFRLW
jgi:hypothetical protein